MAATDVISLIFISVLTLLTGIKCDGSSNVNSETLVTAAISQQLRIPGSATQSMTITTAPEINVHPKPYLDEVEVELIYDEPLFPDGFKVSLMYGPNENETNCNNPMNLVKVRGTCEIIKSITHRERCENLQPGFYCARAHKLLPGGEIGQQLFYSNTVQLVDLSLFSTEGIIVSEVRQSDHDAIDRTKIISIALGICCSLTVLFILRLIIVRRRNDPSSFNNADLFKEREKKLKLIEAVRDLPKVKVFLLYHPECPHHLDFIELLAKLLTCNNCEVSYDQNELNSIAINSESWIQDKLSGGYKILIVNSHSASEQQRIWLENKGVVINESVSNEGHIFLSALAKIMYRPQQAFDYRNVSMLRPSYVSTADVLQNICPLTLYEVPTHLSDLVCNLHELEPQNIDLKAPESELWEHCSVFYSALSKLSEEILGSSSSSARHFTCTPSCQICNTTTDFMNDSHDRLLVV